MDASHGTPKPLAESNHMSCGLQAKQYLDLPPLLPSACKSKRGQSRVIAYLCSSSLAQTVGDEGAGANFKALRDPVQGRGGSEALIVEGTNFVN
jgi:hypothetical protein